MGWHGVMVADAVWRGWLCKGAEEAQGTAVGGVPSPPTHPGKPYLYAGLLCSCPAFSKGHSFLYKALLVPFLPETPQYGRGVWESFPPREATGEEDGGIIPIILRHL